MYSSHRRIKRWLLNPFRIALCAGRQYNELHIMHTAYHCAVVSIVRGADDRLIPFPIISAVTTWRAPPGAVKNEVCQTHDAVICEKSVTVSSNWELTNGQKLVL